MNEVSKEEFDEYISNYPNKLEIDVTGICEPPLKTYNDFTNNKAWPESVVASVSLYESFPKDPKYYPYVWEPNVYRIKEES